MKTCSYCGLLNPIGFFTCNGCGAPLTEYVRPLPVYIMQIPYRISDAVRQNIYETWKSAVAGTELEFSKVIILEDGISIQALQHG